MTIRSVSEAKKELSALLVLVESGEEVVIQCFGKPVAKLVSIGQALKPRKPGALRGKIWIRADFDKSDSEILQMFDSESPQPVVDGLP